MTRIARTILICLVLLVVSAAPAFADRAATPRERARMLAGASAAKGSTAFAKYVRRVAVARVSTVDRRYGAIEWQGTRVHQGGGLVLRKRDTHWRDVPVYVPTVPCGTSLERVLIDLIQRCSASEDTPPRFFSRTTVGTTDCASVIDPFTDDEYAVRIARNAARPRLTCPDARDLLRDSLSDRQQEAWLKFDADVLPQPTDWITFLSNYDGNTIVAAYVIPPPPPA